MTLNFDHLGRTIDTLERSLGYLDRTERDAADYDVFRHAVIKGFELTLETAGKLLRKALQEYGGSPKSVNELMFKDVFRHAAKHGLMTEEEVERWLGYRDSRNNTAHDYGEEFATHVLEMIRHFITDARQLHRTLEARHGGASA